MYRFFINRPIVAMVIAILMVLIGVVSMVSLPISQFPAVVPPEIRIQTTYVGADAQTLEQSVALPIEQQMSGVDNMNYMYSINANNGVMRLVVNFDVKTDPNIDQVLAQLRESQAASQLPAPVQQYGVTILKSPTTPLLLVSLYSPRGSFDQTFLANYAYINLVDQITRLKGISNVFVFGAGQYAMRFWVRPDQLAKLNITTAEVIAAISSQNTVNPAGQLGAPPAAPGQEYTYTAIAQGRLVTEQQFGDIVIRENPDGSLVRLKDVARVELGAQIYNIAGRLNGRPAAVMAIYQLPGSNALEAAKGVKDLMAELKRRFPADLDYAISLDTTLAVSRGVIEILTTLWQALLLVVNPAVPAKSVAELIALAKAQPGQLNFGSGLAGSAGHLAGELFRNLAAVKVVHVPYKGTAFAITDLAAGRLQFVFGTPESMLPLINEGRLHLLAVTTTRRAPSLPGVPTVAESGLPGYDFTGWIGVFVPLRTPASVIRILRDGIVDVLAESAVRQKFEQNASEVVANTPQEFARYLAGELARWKKIAADANIRAE